MKNFAPARTLGWQLQQLADSAELHPEHRVLLRAALAGDPDALLALRTQDGPSAQGLLRALRAPQTRPRLYLVRSPEQVG